VKSFSLHWCVLEALDYSSQRIAENAETLARNKENSTENYTTYKYYGTKAYDPKGVPLDNVENLKCSKNRHFYNEEVNTSFSSVHVPTNVYHRGELEHLLLAYLICFFMQSELDICYVRNEQSNKPDTRIEFMSLRHLAVIA
jgi:hypothetical protein